MTGRAGDRNGSYLCLHLNKTRAANTLTCENRPPLPFSVSVFSIDPAQFPAFAGATLRFTFVFLKKNCSFLSVFTSSRTWP